MNDNKNKCEKKDVALKAGVWYVFSSIFVKVIAVISMPIFTRIMTTAEYGTTSTFISWYTLLLTFCTVNLTYSIGRAKLDFPDEIENYIGSIQLLSACTSGCICFFIVLFINPLSRMMELQPKYMLFLIGYLLFTPAIQFVQNGYRYQYEYKQNIAIAWYISVSTVILSLILIFIFPGDKAFLRIIGIVLPNCFLSIFFWGKSILKRKISFNKMFWKYGFSISAPLVIHTVSMNILAQSDRIFISKICGATDTGIYSLAYSYGILISVVTNAISDGWLPWFHDNYYLKNYHDIKENVKWIVMLGCFVGLACIAFTPEAIMLLGGKKYADASKCVAPIVLGIVCQYVYTHYVNIEMHLKKTKYVSTGTIIAAIINLILNAIFIPCVGYVAAAYTTLISYLILMFMHFFITRFILKIKIYDDKFMFGAVALTSIVSIVIVKTYETNILRYFLIFLGFLIFIFIYRKYILSYFIKNKNKKRRENTN